jgi:hypothetical protein
LIVLYSDCFMMTANAMATTAENSCVSSTEKNDINAKHDSSQNNPSQHSSTSSSTRKDTTTTTFTSHSLHDNLLQTHHRVDPMEFYTIEAVLGEGSMVRAFLINMSICLLTFYSQGRYYCPSPPI